MTPRRRQLAPVGFAIASALFILAAAIPAAKGQPLNPAFLTLSVVFAILGVIAWRKSGGSGGPTSS